MRSPRFQPPCLVRTAFVAILSAASLRPVAAELIVRPARIDFGERGHQESPSVVIELVNESRAPVRVTRLAPSCSCISVEPASLVEPLTPGSRTKLRVSMNSGRAIGTLTKYIELRASESAERSATLRIPVSMRVFDGYSLEPREFRFAGQFGADPVTRTVTVTSKAHRPGERLNLEFLRLDDRARRASPAGKFFDVRISEHPKGAVISVTLSPRHPPGRVWGELRATLDGKPLVLPVAGDMFRGILPSPKYFNFNRVEAGDPATLVEESVLSSIDGQPFKLLRIETRVLRPRNPGFSVVVEAEARRDGLEHVMRARLATASGGSFPARGSFSGRVAIATSHPEKPRIELNFFGFFAPPSR